MSGNNKNMDMLINFECNVQAVDANLCTVLHWAAGIQYNHYTVKFYLYV